MASALYKQYFKEMLEQNKEAFSAFKKTHDLYVQNPDSMQEKFNNEGKPIIEIIRKYENKLCGKSERGSYGRYSAQLSEKFWGEVKKVYPKIDFVGVTIK